MTINVQTRGAAFAIHLALSILILLVLLAVIFFIWFPRDLIYAGGIDGLKILMGVDLVLGPVLTLMVYKRGKKGLKFDLTLIGVVQISCLLAGLWLVFNERPLVQVMADDGIHLLAASDFKYHQIDPPELPGKSPKYVLMDIPEDRDQLSTIKFASEFVDEKPFAFRDDLYLSMKTQSNDLYESRVKFIQELMPKEAFANLARLGVKGCNWIPIHSKHNFGHACVNYEQGIVRLSERNL